MSFDVYAIRRQFPILNEQINGNPLVYLDNAATTQKPQMVLDALNEHYSRSNANVNRGMHVLGERATEAYEDARNTIRKFLGAKHAHEIIFTRNTTEAINLVAKSWAQSSVKTGETVVISELEHHSNIVPWLQLKEEKNIDIAWLETDNRGLINLEQLADLLDKRTVKLVSVTGLSNVLGTMPPLAEMISMAHDKGAKVLVDAAQLVAHRPIDVSELDIDFLACSAHKVYGPTGIGVLYGKTELLEAAPPFLGGGDMIQSVEKTGFTPAELPRKFEAGTPAIAQAVGFAAALGWLAGLDRAALESHEKFLLKHAMQKLNNIPGLKILGPADPDKISCAISFTLEGVHPHDLTEIAGRQGICLRAGHHCTQPLHKKLGIPASTRLSVAAYNTIEEIDGCVEAIDKARKMLNG